MEQAAGFPPQVALQGLSSNKGKGTRVAVRGENQAEVLMRLSLLEHKVLAPVETVAGTEHSSAAAVASSSTAQVLSGKSHMTQHPGAAWPCCA